MRATLDIVTAMSEQAPVLHRADGGAVRVLGVDDEATFSELLAMALHYEGWEVRTAAMLLATGTSVMAIGGFTGSDPYPTLPRFQQYVADGEIRWFVEGVGGAHGAATTRSRRGCGSTKPRRPCTGASSTT